MDRLLHNNWYCTPRISDANSSHLVAPASQTSDFFEPAVLCTCLSIFWIIAGALSDQATSDACQISCLHKLNFQFCTLVPTWCDHIFCKRPLPLTLYCMQTAHLADCSSLTHSTPLTRPLMPPCPNHFIPPVNKLKNPEPIKDIFTKIFDCMMQAMWP